MGLQESVYVIAEAGINHNGDRETALDLVRAAADAGADAVKFQRYTADELTADPEMTAKLKSWELPSDAWTDVAAEAVEADVDFFASVFDTASVADIVDLDPAYLKVGSGEVTNVPLLRTIAATGQPVIMSTGMATLSEVATAVETIRNQHDEIALLHCISAYPVEIEQLNLRAIETLRSAFDVPVGFSDHTTGTRAPSLAVAHGARLVEKHLTLDRSMDGPDHDMSLEPDAFAEMEARIREVQAGLGDGQIGVEPAESETKHAARRGLTAREAINTGEEFTADNVKVSRPETGISPIHYDSVIGLTASTSLERNDPIRWSDI